MMHPASADVKREFFKNHKKPPKNDSESESDSDSESSEEKPRKTGKKNEFYEIINPISTCVGEIGEFQAIPESLPNHPSVGLFGKRRTGKTYTLRCLLFNCFRNVPFGIFYLFHV